MKGWEGQKEGRDRGRERWRGGEGRDGRDRGRGGTEGGEGRWEGRWVFVIIEVKGTMSWLNCGD